MTIRRFDDEGGLVEVWRSDAATAEGFPIRDPQGHGTYTTGICTAVGITHEPPAGGYIEINLC